MKKGCFLKVIIILTILTAAVLYIIQHKFDEIILGPGKKLFSGFAADELEEELSFVKDSPEKDSLIAMASEFIAGKSMAKDFSDTDTEYIKEKFNSYLKDSIITSEELVLIKLEIKKLNERSKKD